MTVGSALLDEVVQEVVDRVGSCVRLATPLGIGKPNPLVNAFYRRAQQDPELDLHVFTALALIRPRWSSDLERRLLAPLVERVFGSYPDPAFAADLIAGKLPANVRVTSFYYQAGSALRSEAAQRSHTSTNYTHVVRDLIAEDVNVLAQLVAAPPQGEDAHGLSLSSNPDLTLDLLPWLLAQRENGRPVALVAQVNRELPFMYGDAVVPRETFDRVLDHPDLAFDLFAPPNEPVTDVDYAIGLHASALIRDGGTIQLGIGALGDSVSHLLLTRHQRNATYLRLLEAQGILPRQGNVVEQLGGTDPFEEGLYGDSEMLMQGLLELFRGGVLRRTSGSGHVLHSSFFLGPRAFYRALRELPVEERKKIAMTRISFVNQLYGEEETKRRDRRDARFLNTAIIATLLGGVASDGLEDGRVVSGVGGQYNFVAMAHELDGARSILMVRTVRESGGRTTSNIRFSYGHETVPRHLRDVVVTEYGIADLRGKPDEEVVAAMLQVADSRFQDDLLREAKDAHKIAQDYEIPDVFCDNNPERTRAALKPFRNEGALPEYPFGTDLTGLEIGLARSLRHLKRTLSGDLSVPQLGDLKKTLDIPDAAVPYLERMELADPHGLEEKVLRRAVVYGLAAEDVI